MSTDSLRPTDKPTAGLTDEPTAGLTDEPADESADALIGQLLDGRYRIIEQLSEGAMGIVYLAERVKLRRRVAIKFLRAAYAMNGQLRARFDREARAMSQLSHPHCVSVIDFGVAAGTPYIVMERVVGTDLQDMLENGPVSASRAVDITCQMLAGLAHAHGHGVIHRDIKPANIMLTDATGTGDYVRLLDFGLAKLADKSAADISTANIVIGTPNYMSPEQSLGDAIDERTDIYSTGIVLFELLTGIKPFAADDNFEILRGHRDDPVPKLRSVAPDLVVPAGLEVVLRKALAKKPDNRYRSAIDFANALKSVAQDERARVPVAMAEGVQAGTMAVARPGSGTRLLLALVATAGVAAAAWYGWQLSHPGAPDSTSSAAATAARESAQAPPAIDPAQATAALGLPADAHQARADASMADASMADAGAADASAADAAIEASAQADAGSVAMAASDAGIAAPEAPPARATPITWDAAKALIRAGKREQAITVLRKLQRRNRKSALVPYTLGNLYFEKNWWVLGMDAYDRAISNNRGYRTRKRLIANAIKALASTKSGTRKRVYSLFLDRIGRSGLPALKRAAKSQNRNVRSHASWLLKRMKRMKRTKRRR